MQQTSPLGARETAEAALRLGGWRSLHSGIAAALDARLALANDRYKYFRKLEMLLVRCAGQSLSETAAATVRANEGLWNERRWQLLQQQARLGESAAEIATVEANVADVYETCRLDLADPGIVNLSADSTQHCLAKIAVLKQQLWRSSQFWADYERAWLAEWQERDNLWTRGDAQYDARWSQWLGQELPSLQLPAWAANPAITLQSVGAYGAITCPNSAGGIGTYPTGGRRQLQITSPNSAGGIGTYRTGGGWRRQSVGVHGAITCPNSAGGIGTYRTAGGRRRQSVGVHGAITCPNSAGGTGMYRTGAGGWLQSVGAYGAITCPNSAGGIRTYRTGGGRGPAARVRRVAKAGGGRFPQSAIPRARKTDDRPAGRRHARGGW
jgi:hypothetical protein